MQASIEFFKAALFPIPSFAVIFNLGIEKEPSAEKEVDRRATSYLDILGTFGTAGACLRNSYLALACIYGFSLDFNSTSYPAYGLGTSFSLEWILPILIRNLIATHLICGLWDYILYFSPLKERLHPFKFNPNYPDKSQIFHDAFQTSIATLCGTFIEVLLCYCWANNYIFPSFQRNFFDSFYLNVFLLLTVTHWRIPHFYVIHRMMHPWYIPGIPDGGKLLYKWVHGLHHKSYNTTAYSGTNMHTVEATLYYSAAILPVIFGLHPSIALSCIIDCGIGAWLGHDGFQYPGSGDFFHHLHHAHFDCNYGAQHVPLDYLFGSFISCKDDMRNKKMSNNNNNSNMNSGKTK